MKNVLHVISEIPSILILFIVLISVGIIFQYSVTASWHPWAFWHLTRAVVFFPIIFFISAVDIKKMYKSAYPAFLVCTLLLFFVQFFGHTGMGAKRWVNLYFLKLQPSEFMKVALILFLARYYSDKKDSEMSSILTHIKAFLISLIPLLLVAKQPDLGTALILFFLLCFTIFVCGLKKRYVIATVILISVSPALVWNKLHNYQKQRVVSFLNPESDPRGHGYHIIQSKIAIGSGGVYGKGFLNGTQSKLNFLPEKHTDFIFTSICEETGFIGAMSIIFSFVLLIISIMSLAYSCNNRFCLLIGLGTAFMLFEHAMINMAMVSGLIPIVGVPLPFISYGGSSLLAFCILIGMLANIAVNRNAKIGHRGY